MTDKEHEGWTNRETRCVFEWLLDMQGEEYWIDQAGWTLSNPADALAFLIQAEVEKEIGTEETTASSLLYALVGNALDEALARVNYLEIAEALRRVAEKLPNQPWNLDED